MPLMTFDQERDDLRRWADRRGSDAMGEYWATKNAQSIDGLPGLSAGESVG